MNKVLIIEDDQSIARLEKDYLEINGFETIHESEGDLDKIMAYSKEVDLIILDLMLPQTDGYEICKHLRKSVDLPIIIISAKDQDMDKVLGLGFGATDYMTKPFSPSELIARVKAHLRNYELLRGSNSAKEEIVSIKDLTIDILNKRVTIGDVEIELTKKEFKILLLLAQNKGRVFSKEEIYDNIWDQDALGYYDTVSVHVRRIREKLEPNPAKPRYIETLWGLGYRIK